MNTEQVDLELPEVEDKDYAEAVLENEETVEEESECTSCKL